jgi:hypothetical protein
MKKGLVHVMQSNGLLPQIQTILGCIYIYFTAISIQIQREQPFFGCYENGWPICSMMQTYLLNSKQAAKRRHAALAQSDDQEEIKGEEAGVG